MKFIKLLSVSLVLFGCSGEQPSTPDLGSTQGFFNFGQSRQLEKQNISFKAAIVKGSGDITPVVTTEFTAKPYSTAAEREVIRVKNNIGPSPAPDYGEKPRLTEDRFDDPFISSFDSPQEKARKQQIIDNCNKQAKSRAKEFNITPNPTTQNAWNEYPEGFQCMAWSFIERQIYDKRKEEYEQKTIPEWEKKAYAGLSEHLKQIEKETGRELVKFTTDLSGEAEIKLAPGDWYFDGSYSILQGKSNVFWIDTKFVVDEDTKKIELSNNNGEVINTGS